jgi:hypothetical protein
MDLFDQREMLIDSGKYTEGGICAAGNMYIYIFCTKLYQ